MAAEQPSHNEVWDDSALIDSWNEALEEYKKYHSIAAKGERVEDVLAVAEKAETDVYVDFSYTHTIYVLGHITNQQSSLEETAGSFQDKSVLAPEGEAKDAVMEDQVHVENAPAIPVSEPEQIAVEHPLPTTNGISSAMPQAMMNTVQDEGLKNLMMSWYYAGYYTGLYEGQQKANLAGQASKQAIGKVG
ncbi:hypothetical protein AAFC00_003186 [Neodothiora populina]|uniref:Survival Motor Neuron Gemin2-binding domain-containing protein n=1 Tax=Neodothiora populina TaxID=2781224 RepID=A0ABR3P9V7_9PEZI